MAHDMQCLKLCGTSRNMALALTAVLVLSIRPAVGATAQAKAPLAARVTCRQAITVGGHHGAQRS